MNELRMGMSREPIEMATKRHGYFPNTFVWRGRRHQVQTVERCWTESSRHGYDQAERHYFRVRCAAGRFDLAQDIQRNEWTLERVAAA